MAIDRHCEQGEATHTTLQKKKIWGILLKWTKVASSANGLLAMTSLVIPFLAAAVMIYGWPVAADNDIFFHIKAGEMTLKHGPLFRDVFTYTAAGRPDECWHSWLGQVIFYLFHRSGGFTGLKILNFGLLSLTLFAVGRFVARRTGSVGAALIAMTVALLIHHHVQILRPLLFGETLFSLSMFWLLSREGPLSRRDLGLLAFTGALWANLHGSAVIFPFFVAAFALPRKCVTAPLAALLGTFLNPKGPLLYPYALELTRRGKAAGNWEWGGAKLIEWSRPFAEAPQISLSLDVPSLVIGLGALAVLAHLWREKSARRWTLVLPCALALVLPLLSVRHVTYLSLPATLLVLEFWRESKRATLGAVVLSITALFVFRFHRSFDVTPSIEKTSNFVAETGLEGNLFCDPAWANYVTFRNYPKLKVARDTRTLLHWDFYDEANRLWDRYGSDAWDILVEGLGEDTDFVLMHSWRDHFPYQPGEWIVIYENNHAALALRRNARNTANLTRVSDYYRDRGISFDSTRGFETGLILSRHKGWFDTQRESMGWGLWPEEAAIEHWKRKQKEFYESRWRSAPLG